MYILDPEWNNQYLDYYCGREQSRIKVLSWFKIATVDDMYIIRKRDPALIYNYLREIGPIEVARKIISRKKERLRNQKFLSAGRGLVTETNGTKHTVGNRVAFLAPSHPLCVDEIVLDDILITPTVSVSSDDDEKAIAYYADAVAPRAEWLKFAGWSEFSGSDLDCTEVEHCLQQLDLAMSEQKSPTRNLPVLPRPILDRTAKTSVKTDDKLTATLFGLGNYAKTIILPNLDRRITVDVVHEIDPTQLGSLSALRYAADTSPLLRDEEQPDIVLIAGFHHTHADLAIQALERGAVAVVEKPLVTCADQLDRLCRTLEKTRGRLYAGFHKRYSPFNDYITRDLCLAPSDPVSCHCIVYEIPLPSRHWYEWPNSGSRIVSNGCHWIDHFLFLNGFSPVIRNGVTKTASGEFVIVLELENGASFFMALTDIGSARIGVQEHVQFRANGRTSHIVNAASYFAESGSRVLRRKSVHKYASFRAMYRTISSRIVNGETGDSIESTIASSRAMLKLEAVLQSQGS